MKGKVREDYEEMSDTAAELALQVIREKPDCVLGLTAGSSPLGLYRRLHEAYHSGEIDFSRVRIFTLSEYIGLDAQDERSFAYYTRKNFCEGLNLSEDRIFMPDGMAADIAGRMVEREINPDDHRELVEEFIRNAGEAS